MNTIIFFLAGVAIGMATDKLYHSYFKQEGHADEAESESSVAGSTEKDVSSDQGGAVDEQVKEVKTAEPEEEAPARVEAVPIEVEERRDDLTLLKGVGPKLASALNEIGIHSYEQLSGSSVDVLLEQLKSAGGNFNKPAISSVVEQARLAVDAS